MTFDEGRKAKHGETESGDDRPLKDLPIGEVPEENADRVRGGKGSVSEIVITKPADKAST